MDKFINWGTMADPESEYPVSYTIDNKGNRIEGEAILKGKDLTENQIKEGFFYLCQMQSPELAWLTHPAINRSEIARRLGVDVNYFTNKLKGSQYKKFSDEELEKLRQIKVQLLKELE